MGRVREIIRILLLVCVCAGLLVVDELKPEMVDNCSSPDLPSGKL